MSSLGKFFAVANLGLAALFVGAAASLIATSEDYRKKYDTEKTDRTADVERLEGEISSLNSQLDDKNGQVSRKDSQISQLNADVSSRDSALTTERQKNADMRESLDGIGSKLGDLEQTNRSQANRITELTNQNQQLRGERDGALDERDAANSSNTQAQEDLRLSEMQMRDLQATLDRVSDERNQFEAQIAQAAREFNIDFSTMAGAQPDLEGVVLSSSYSGTPIIMINLGRSQGVRPGYTFDVYNGRTFKGQIRVEVVNENNSAAVISLGSEHQINQGDRVATRI